MIGSLRTDDKKAELKRKIKEAEANNPADLQKLKLEEAELLKQEEEFRLKEEELKKKERV